MIKFKYLFIFVCLFLGLIEKNLARNIHINNSNIIVDSLIIENPVDVQYIKRNLRKNMPRLILTPKIKNRLKKEIKTNQVVQNVYKSIKLNVKDLMEEPFLKYHKIGKSLLRVSRRMLYRMNLLGIVYVVEKDPKILDRINEEIIAVCNFDDWNPTHFVDVAEISMAISIGLDWTEGNLPKSTIKIAKKALIEKGIKPSYKDNHSWHHLANNWNQVCNGGMIAASLAIADVDPALAAKTISKSLKEIPYGLSVYDPNGVYPEGPSYWTYGTTFSVLTSSMLKSALGTDFGLSKYKPLMESAKFYLLSIAPSGDYYNFSDCDLKRREGGDYTLAWFAKETGEELYFQSEKLLKYSREKRTLPRYAGAGLIWMSQFVHNRRDDQAELPLTWKGEGKEPVVFFRGRTNDYYFAAKGGKADHSHGNMDAGSFIFELNGERWVIDPGNQNYHDILKTGFDLWGRCQTCDRWNLLTTNNFGHSTVTVNDNLFDVYGFVPIISFNSKKPLRNKKKVEKNSTAEVAFDMTKLYCGNIKHFIRKFIKPDNHSLIIEDHFKTNDSTKLITWQLITTADVEFVKRGAILHQNGKQLKVDILSPYDINFSVVSLNPPPLKLDKIIKNLKCLELQIPAWVVKNKEGIIKIRLEGVGSPKNITF